MKRLGVRCCECPVIEKNELSFDGLPIGKRQKGRKPPDNLAGNSDVVA